MTDGQTDGQTDRRTELRWLRRAIAVPAVARKNRPISSEYMVHGAEFGVMFLTYGVVWRLVLTSIDCKRNSMLRGVRRIKKCHTASDINRRKSQQNP